MTVRTYALILMAIGIAVLLDISRPYDDTDPPIRAHPWDRSGLRLYTDHGTGCQYISTMFGDLVARRDGSGKHVGCRSQPSGAKT